MPLKATLQMLTVKNTFSWKYLCASGKQFKETQSHSLCVNTHTRRYANKFEGFKFSSSSVSMVNAGIYSAWQQRKKIT